MSSLSVLPAPARKGDVTVCEYNALFMTEDSTRRRQDSNNPSFQMQDYPKIVPGLESLKSPHSLALPSPTPAFLPTDEGLVAKLLHLWYSEGTKSVFEECCNSENDKVPSWLTKMSSCGLKIYEIIDAIYGKLFPHVSMSKEEIIANFSLVADWEISPNRAFAWHPHTFKFAIGFKDDSVRVHTLGSPVNPILKHKQQKDITCLEWRPLSSTDLAIGCCNGVFIWYVDPNSSATRPRSSSVKQLSRPGHSPITSISWSPSGRLLASGSPVDSAMLIWDVSMETATALRRVGGGSSLLRWSPDETKLFSATPSKLFRVWETKTWTMEKWSNFEKKCQCSCWSPDGTILLFAIEGDSSIFSLKFEPSQDDVKSSDLIGGSKMAVKLVDLSTHTWEVDNELITIGGSVHSMAWDPHGERLAVILKDETGKTQEFVVVFRTKLKPNFEIMACGTVRGSNGEIPQIVSFQENFNRGAMLTVCWSSGSITFIPLVFTPIAELTREYTSPRRLINGNSLYSENPGFFTEH